MGSLFSNEEMKIISNPSSASGYTKHKFRYQDFKTYEYVVSRDNDFVLGFHSKPGMEVLYKNELAWKGVYTSTNSKDYDLNSIRNLWNECTNRDLASNKVAYVHINDDIPNASVLINLNEEIGFLVPPHDGLLY